MWSAWDCVAWSGSSFLRCSGYSATRTKSAARAVDDGDAHAESPEISACQNGHEFSSIYSLARRAEVKKLRCVCVRFPTQIASYGLVHHGSYG
jgi:hypothetical protein